MQNVTMSMKGVVKGLDRAMAAMNLAQVTDLLDKFEKQQEDIDVKVTPVVPPVLAQFAAAGPGFLRRGMVCCCACFLTYCALQRLADGHDGRYLPVHLCSVH